MATAAQIAANQRNCLLARGPRTIQGRLNSRGNSLKHGLTGAGVVMLPEDRETYEHRRAAWAEELGVVEDARTYLVDRAALASVRLDRCVTIESARLADRADEAERTFDRRERRKARALGTRLAEDPATIGARLRGFAAGCRWLIERLDALAGSLQGTDPVDGALWGDGLLLVGESVAWLREFADDPEARRTVLVALGFEREKLAVERDRLEAEVEGPARQHARTLALFDPSDEAARLAKYEAMHESTLHRSLKAVGRRPRVDRLPEPDFEPEDAETLVENEPNFAPAGVENEPNPAPAGVENEPNPAVLRVVPRPVRNEPKHRRRQFVARVLLGALAGLLLGLPRDGEGRPNTLLDRAFRLFSGSVERPRPAPRDGSRPLSMAAPDAASVPARRSVARGGDQRPWNTQGMPWRGL
jgi:hypothetical protein